MNIDIRKIIVNGIMLVLYVLIVYAGNTRFAKGEVLVIDENFGIRLTELL